MPWPEFLAFVALVTVFGGMSGVVAGLFGIGGGVVIVPLLDTIFKFQGVSPDVAIHTAIGTSLLTIVPTSIASIRIHARYKAIDQTILKEWSVAVISGAILGGLIANHLSGATLTLIFGVFVLAIAAFIGAAPADLHFSKHPPKGVAQKSLAFSIGMISSMVGIGGGSLTVPTLIMCRTSVHRAIGTASVMGLLISLPAALVFMLSEVAHGAKLSLQGDSGATLGSFGNVDLLAFAILAPVTMMTAPYGARLAHRLPAANLRKIFGALLAVIAVKMIIVGLH